MFEETKKKFFIENEEKKKFSQAYILYNDAGVGKPTYISELIFFLNSRYFQKKITKNSNIFTENNKKNFLQPKKKNNW